MKTRERLALTGLAAGTLAVIVGYGWAPVDDMTTASASAPEWQLVSVPPATASVDSQAIAPLFGGSATSSDAATSSSAASPGYLILAVATDDEGRRFVLVRLATDSKVRLFVGDTLPDGARITDIQPTYIEVIGPTDAPARRINLY